MTQDQALSILRTGASVFLTGEAGSGKTHVVNRYAAYLRSRGIPYAMTASTGIAATHIRGTTIHSWSGVGANRDMSDEGFEQLVKNRRAVRRIREARVLVIDEVSMLDARVLSLVERMCRRAKGSTSLPFGGLQVVLVGDFFQLPPVSREGASRFAFESSAWDALRPVVCYLHEQHRQEDPAFLSVLSAIRRDEVGEEHLALVRGRILGRDDVPDEDLPVLFSHNADVDGLNAAALDRLPGRSRVFLMAKRGPDKPLEALVRGCLSPERLELKEGASVMFTKNNPDEGYVNGTLGTVIGFDAAKKFPIVRTRDGEAVTVAPAEWLVEEGEEIVARVRQIPLRLAWSITIHKSQGVSLDAAVMDLSRVFEYGQGYVALSRVRTLAGLSLVGLSDRAFATHPSVREKDRLFREESERAERAYGSRSEEEIRKDEEAFLVLCGVSGKKEGGPHGRAKGTAKKGNGKRKAAGAGGGFDEIRKKHPKAYMPWKEDEDKWLRRLFQGGADVKSIAEALGRQPGSIRARMRKLGLEGD
ncbi:MAG: AAA family ATPase [Candidatus Moranbacteria bacterium]|nr:AAA family ATPase [Candidatus Moranbacteria bacterium]NTW45990.1 AAA family ATPase [Candidatus Moranbacteria bacterium]